MDLSLTAQLTFPGGVLGLIDCSFEQPFRCVYELVGTKGAITVPVPSRAVFTRLAAPRPMATITFAFQALVDPRTLDPDAPLFHAARALGNDDGYVAEIRELYTESGRLVGLNQQTFAVLG